MSLASLIAFCILSPHFRAPICWRQSALLPPSCLHLPKCWGRVLRVTNCFAEILWGKKTQRPHIQHKQKESNILESKCSVPPPVRNQLLGICVTFCLNPFGKGSLEWENRSDFSGLDSENQWSVPSLQFQKHEIVSNDACVAVMKNLRNSLL